jgi:CheY-like chemotaxis protein
MCSTEAALTGDARPPKVPCRLIQAVRGVGHKIILRNVGSGHFVGLSGLPEMTIRHGERSVHLTANRTPATVLFVEDEALVRLDVADALRLAGYKVVEAGDADEAIAILKSGFRIDLLVTDVKMPGSRDGLELAEVVRQLFPEVRIVVTSAVNTTAPMSYPTRASSSRIQCVSFWLVCQRCLREAKAYVAVVQHSKQLDRRCVFCTERITELT